MDQEAANLPTEPLDDRPGWGSDLIAGALRELGIEYVALNPGASFRGLHDSLVNHLGNRAPHLLLCLHEEHAVAIAHGWAKVTGSPMAVAVHTNVGLQHAAMGLFNAWCDRIPVVVVGSNGPLDAARRRPWIDGLHTAADPAAPVRGQLKYEDQPGSLEATRESLERAHWLARVRPAGPALVTVDVSLQEAAWTGPPPPAVASRPVHDPAPAPDALDRLATALTAAQRPVMVFGRTERDEAAWARRLELVERTGARVVTDLRVAASFPTRHPAHVGPPGLQPSPPVLAALADADLVVAFEPVDLAGMLPGRRTDPRPVTVVALDAYAHDGGVKDHQALVPGVDHVIGAPDLAVAGLLERLPAGPRTPAPVAPVDGEVVASSLQPASERPLGIRDLAHRVNGDTVRRHRPSLLRLPLGWPADLLDLDDPLDYLGTDGGAGIGSGPGMAVGAALALRGSGRLPVAILGDGDLLMGVTALWTAVAERIPLLVLVADNRSFLNDELHQVRMAQVRGRSEGNRWVGQQIDDPPVDLAAMARAQGAVGFGPVTTPEELDHALERAVAEVVAGRVALVDVIVRSEFDPQTLSQTVVPR